MLNSKAVTKLHSIILVAIVVFAVVGGSVAYISWNGTQQFSVPIRIGISADLDNTIGKGVLQAAILAAEQINAQGGVLGRNFTIVAEDDDGESGADPTIGHNAMVRLVTIDKADFVISNTGAPQVFFSQISTCAQNNKIMFTTSAALDNYTRQVLDNYDQYKYFFKFYSPNSTAIANTLVNDIVAIGKYSGFNKIAILSQDVTSNNYLATVLNNSVVKQGFEVVYNGKTPPTTTDFTSYLAAIESSGAQILVPIFHNQASASFIKEWCDRESPFIVVGIIIGSADVDFWNKTDGKCEYVTTRGPVFMAGYPLTNKSESTREAYLARWGTVIPTGFATATYDGIRYILADAIKRAGTIDTEAVIKTLETTDVETSMARHFVYTKSHDIMIGMGFANPPEKYMLFGQLQWQANRTLIPVVPETIMTEGGASYKYPPWQGPWSIKQPP
jgi:branched-chain amino acid transport system substrate-binding protein